jgi:hypothetical protein
MLMGITLEGWLTIIAVALCPIVALWAALAHQHSPE